VVPLLNFPWFWDEKNLVLYIMLLICLITYSKKESIDSTNFLKDLARNLQKYHRLSKSFRFLCRN